MSSCEVRFSGRGRSSTAKLPDDHRMGHNGTGQGRIG
jgi:hypothetical protein